MSDSWAREMLKLFRKQVAGKKIWMTESSVFPLLAGSAFVENAFLFLQPSEISL